MKKRITSMLLSLVMAFSLLPQGIAFAVDSKTPTISVSSTSALAGETVNLDVTIANNPGILGATLTLAYDEGLTLQNVKAGDAFSALTFTKPGKFTSPCNFVWDAQELEADEIKDGVILTLTFKVSDSISAGNTLNVRLTCKDSDVSDVNLHSVHIETISGSIGVVDYTPGDVDSDTIVNTTDVIKLRRHLAGGYDNLVINEAAADVNADTYINTTDVILMRRFLAGGYTDGSGNPLKLLPAPSKCNHTLEAVSAHNATCTEAGNVAHWRCTNCGKLFSNAAGTAEISLENTVIPATGHIVMIDPAVPATTTSMGLTEGSHCSVCGEVIVAQQETATLPDNSYSISYDVSNGDPYLVNLLAKGELSNPNPDRYSVESGIALRNLSAAGYRFLGWYDGAGNNAAQIKRIEANTTHDVELYAHWDKIEYTIQFKSDIFLDENEITYSVDKGAVLPTPRLSNYVFAGWSDEDGKLYGNTKIPVGTTGNITLTANWTSERNKTWTKKLSKEEIENPVVYEDEENKTILFAYEIGEIQNIPLYTIKDFGYISGDGITRTETATYSTTISESYMQSFAKAVASATTQSSSWTLSEDWNETTSIDEKWCQERGLTQAEAEAIAKSDTGAWNISSSKDGSTDITRVETNQDNWENQVKINSSKENTSTHKEASSLSSTTGSHMDGSISMNAIGAKWEVSAGISSETSKEVNVEDENSSTRKKGLEVGGAKGNTQTTSDSSASHSGWSNSSSYSGSNTSSQSTTTSKELSERISSQTGYGKSYINGGSSSNTQGLSATSSSTDEYGASVTYSTATSQSRTSTWTTQATKAGYHRWIVAGTAHVFGVIGYDMTTQSFYVYTYSIMDDETHEFEDYSYTTASYNDHQNGVISFEIPYYVTQYVSSRVNYSSGLKVNQNSGIITGYNGTDNCVVIPEYMNIGDGQVVKVTGIGQNAFQGNQSIKAVVLSDFITEIPSNAFKGCSSLIGVVGGEINKIGSQAFSGCTSMQDCGITTAVTSLGTKAFEGVKRLMVNAANVGVAESAINSGANEVILYLKQAASSLDGKVIHVPSSMGCFELNGYGATYHNTTIVSDAEKTVINRARFDSFSSIPLQISSPEVILNDVTATASGIAMVLSAENARLGLQSEIIAASSGANTFLCKNVSLYESNPNADGLLNVKGKLLTCGTIENDNLLVYKSYEKITADAFDKLQCSYTLYFDANGGTCNAQSMIVPNGVAIGKLPEPQKQKNTFTGWYLSDGTRVTDTTVFSDGVDRTLYAHWSLNQITVTFNANGGSCGESTRKVTVGEPYGKLPTATLTYYTFDGWYTAASGGSKVSESSSSNENVTLYAHWTKNKITVSFNANGGSCGETSRKVTIGDPFGNLPTPSHEYYTFDYWYLSSGSKATASSTSNTDVTLYAHWTPKTYTVSWTNPTNATIKVERTSSPSGLGSSGTLSSGSTVYYKDVLKITYAANTGYSLASKGKEQITVSGNIGSGDIYATTSANSYTYTIQYRSSNGTNLGSSSATYKFGTTNTISAPAKSGYNTPGSQSVKWDSTSKTITFTYSPSSVSYTTKSARFCTDPVMTYDATVEYQNRTASSVQLRVIWKTTIANGFNTYGQYFRASSGSASTGDVQVAAFRTWASTVNYARSSTGTSGWITVPLGTTNATTVNLSIYYFETNANYTDMTAYYGVDGVSANWSIAIPAY